MKYLVTGGAGFIGSHIARQLIDQGHRVWILDNLFTGKQENIPAGCEFLKIDISVDNSLNSLPPIRFDAVLHLAAQSSGQISHENPSYDLLTNTFGTLQLLEWCNTHGVRRFLYASSMAAYGLLTTFPVHEDAAFVPHSFYGINKVASEHYIHHFQTKGLQPTIFRMFNVYGPGQNLSNMKQGMVSIYLAFILNKEKFLVRGSKDRFRDLIFIDDVVSAWSSALDNPASAGRTYNLGSGKPIYVWELIRDLLLAFGYDPDNYPVEYGESTPGDQFGIYADISRIQADLGWNPKVELRDGLQRMVKWAQNLK